MGIAASVGLMYLSNLLRRPAPHVSGEVSRTYSFHPSTNFMEIGQAVPVVYGTRRTVPGLVQSFIETVGDDQFFHGLYLVSAGRIESIGSIELNEQPIGNFANAQTEMRLGDTAQAQIPWFADTRVTRAHGITMDADATSSVFTMPEGTTAQALIVNLRFPNGLNTLGVTGGAIVANGINVTIEYRVFGVTPWTLLTTTDIREIKRNNFSRPFRVDTLAIARYEVRVTRNSTADRSANSQFSMIFDTVDTITYGNSNFNNFAMIGLRVKATDQLSGQPPRVSCLASGRRVRMRSAGAWTAETFTRNPVWHVVDMMTNTQYGGGAYVTDAQLDIPALESAATYFDELVDNLAAGTEARFVHDAVFDTQQEFYDAIDQVLRNCRSTMIDVGGVYKFHVDRPRSFTQVFGNHNIIRKTFKNGFVSLKEEFNQVEVVFYDAAADYVRETVRFPTATPSPLKRKQIEMRGTTRRSQALREAKYHMNAISALSRWVSCECFLEGLAAEAGDVIEVSHDVPQWGFPGRVLASAFVSGSTYDLTVDRDDLPAPTDHRMLVRHETDLIELGTVVSVTGRVARVSGLTRLPKVRDSGYAYGPVNATSKKYQIQEATMTSKFDRGVFAVEYNESIYDATGLVLPTRSPSALLLTDAPPGSVRNLTLVARISHDQDGTLVGWVDVVWNTPLEGATLGEYNAADVYYSLYQGVDANLIAASWLFAETVQGRTFATLGPFPTNVGGGTTLVRVRVVSISRTGVRQAISAGVEASVTLNPSGIIPIIGIAVAVGQTGNPAMLIDGTNRRIDIRDSGGTTRVRVGRVALS